MSKPRKPSVKSRLRELEKAGWSYVHGAEDAHYLERYWNSNRITERAHTMEKVLEQATWQQSRIDRIEGARK